jgi:hypothetical protein
MQLPQHLLFWLKCFAATLKRQTRADTSSCDACDTQQRIDGIATVVGVSLNTIALRDNMSCLALQASGCTSKCKSYVYVEIRSTCNTQAAML